MKRSSRRPGLQHILEDLRQHWKTWHYGVFHGTATEKPDHAWNEFMKAQHEALQSGTEIEPPWVVFRGSAPWNYNQGDNEGWMMFIWQPFWMRLTKEERRAYVQKWNADAQWEDLLLGSWFLIGRYDAEAEQKRLEWLQLFNAQEEASRLGKEIESPWVIYPGSEPRHYTFGVTKEWLYRVWMPFWKRLTPEERRAYVEKRDTPPLWQDLLLGAWLEYPPERQTDAKAPPYTGN